MVSEQVNVGLFRPCLAISARACVERRRSCISFLSSLRPRLLSVLMVASNRRTCARARVLSGTVPGAKGRPDDLSSKAGGEAVPMNGRQMCGLHRSFTSDSCDSASGVGHLSVKFLVSKSRLLTWLT